MGTTNFAFNTVSKVYAVFMNREEAILDEDGNETCETEWRAPEMWEIEDERKNFIDALMEASKKNGYGDGGLLDEYDSESNRNYPTHKLVSWELMKEFKDRQGETIHMCIECTAVYTTGYYEGACFDIQTRVHIDGDNVGGHEDEISGEYIKADISFETINEMEAFKKETFAKMIPEMEAVFAELSEVKMHVVGRFSNGETLYEKE